VVSVQHGTGLFFPGGRFEPLVGSFRGMLKIDSKNLEDVKGQIHVETRYEQYRGLW